MNNIYMAIVKDSKKQEPFITHKEIEEFKLDINKYILPPIKNRHIAVLNTVCPRIV